MSNADYLAASTFTNATWTSRDIDLQGLSLPGKKSITITVPLEEPIVATFSIEDGTVEGTPISAITRIYSHYRDRDRLKMYKSKDDEWLLGDKLILRNGEVAFIALPVNPVIFIIGTTLMRTCSPMAKMIKEKVIPRIVDYNNADVRVLCTRNWKLHTFIDTPITRANQVILRHIDEI